MFDVGFSGHHKGISFDIAAYTLGANYIERHFTLAVTVMSVNGKKISLMEKGPSNI